MIRLPARGTHARRAIPFGAGFVTSALILVGLSVLISPRQGTSRLGERRDETASPERDIQVSGPFPIGQRVSLEEAKERTPYALPIPPTDQRTGELTGVWMDPPVQAVGFVWKTDLRMYVYVSDQTPRQALQQYQQQAAQDPGRWTITTVRGHHAVGADLAGFEPTSSLAFIDRGLDILIVSPSHTLEELRAIAEDIAYE